MSVGRRILIAALDPSTPYVEGVALAAKVEIQNTVGTFSYPASFEVYIPREPKMVSDDLCPRLKNVEALADERRRARVQLTVKSARLKKTDPAGPWAPPPVPVETKSCGTQAGGEFLGMAGLMRCVRELVPSACADDLTQLRRETLSVEEAVMARHEALLGQNEQLICTVCQERPRNRLLKCGHLFCGDCVGKFSGRCPVCRALYRDSEVVSVYL